MNISKDQIDDLNAVITIKVGPDDYEKQVDKVLSDHRKKAVMPGFRPGKVPMGVIKKMYRKAVLAEELNKILSHELYQYINEQDLKMLGNPIPAETEEMDMDTQSEFEFSYELGLAPLFEANISAKEKFNQYTIKVDDKLIDKYAKDIAKRYGKVSNVEVSEDEDLLFGQFKELDETGQVLEGGIQHTSTITIEYVEDEAVKKQLIGLKVGSVLTLDPKKVSKGTPDLAKMLSIDHHQAEALESQFEFTVMNIHHLDPSELTQELYDKVFGPGNVSDEEEFRGKISEELVKMLEKDSEYKLRKDISDRLVEKMKLSLPDAFLKKWLQTAGEKPLSEEQIEADYENYSKDLQLQLIENKIMEENEIKVEQNDLMERAKELLRQQLRQYGQTEFDDEQLTATAENILKKEEDVRQLYDQIREQKLMDLYKSTFKLTSKEVSFDDFVKLASGKSGKSSFMDNLNNFLKF